MLSESSVASMLMSSSDSFYSGPHCATIQKQPSIKGPMYKGLLGSYMGKYLSRRLLWSQGTHKTVQMP